MAEVMPRGRMDGRFRARAAALGRRKIEEVFLRLAPLLAFATPPGARFGPFPLDLSPSGEEARRGRELHFTLPIPATLTLAAGARLELAHGGIRIIQRGPPPVWTPRPLIEGSDLVLARRAISTRAGLRAGGRTPALARRLGRALAMIRDVWEDGYREVLAHTRTVVPLAEKNTVSFSLPDRPGVSYINVSGKSLVDLADDLLHETAHHRLHGLEELRALDRDDGEPRYWSPWRRSLRPLHGILHATYTFTWRAELLSRLRGRRGRLPRRWIDRELSFEIEALRSSLRDLADAERRGLLTPAGSRLRKALARRVGRLSTGARRG
jgi:HEXXH motif-containing protein